MSSSSRKRTDSIDSRSHSFDSTEKEKTKPIKLKVKVKKCRKRDQPLVQIQSSPVPTNWFNYYMIFEK
tara:strand:+ start:9465 stop:9668 length:204 start_codon:yes stop_codon:yes gene_type:complete